MDFKSYGSFEEIMEELGQAMKEADARVKPTQASIRPGQHFINFRHGPELPIFGKVLNVDDPIYNEPHMRYYRLTNAHSVACSEGEIGDIHVSDIDAIIDKELFKYYQDQNWSPLTRKGRSNEKISKLLKYLDPLFQHSNIFIEPTAYNLRTNTLHLDINPRSSPEWAKIAYQFAHHEGMRYDKETEVYRIDGQPRVSYSGFAWVRFINDFEEGSKVVLNIWSQQPSHMDAENQLKEYYGRFLVHDNLNPVGVFKKYFSD
jgi:hypothetical protein